VTTAVFRTTLQAAFVMAAACWDFSDEDRTIDDGGYQDLGRYDGDSDGGSDRWPDIPLDGIGGPAPSVAWALRFEGEDWLFVSSMLETGPDQFFLAGWGSPTDESHRSDLWMASMEGGTLAWRTSRGGYDFDGLPEVLSVRDGGVVVVGQTYSYDRVNPYTWILRVDDEGGILWEKVTGEGKCIARAAIEDNEGNLFIFGEYQATSDTQACMMKLDSRGEVLVYKSIGGSREDVFHSAASLADGSIVAVGETMSFGAGSYDSWIVRLDLALNVIWQKTFGGTGYDMAGSVAASDDGGILVAGTLAFPEVSTSQILAVKLDPDGTVVFNKIIEGMWGSGGIIEQFWGSGGYDVAAARDGGMIVAGKTWLTAGGPATVAVLKLDASGEPAWQVGIDRGYFDLISVMESLDGGVTVLATEYNGWLISPAYTMLAKLVEADEPTEDCSLRQEIAMAVQDSPAVLTSCDAPVAQETSRSYVPSNSLSDMPIHITPLCPD
jgi:hypothetical protein